MLLGQMIRHPVADRVAGDFYGHPVQVTARTRRCRRSVWHFGCVGCGDFDEVQWHAKPRRRDLCDFLVQPLPHFGTAVVHLNRAVLIDMHQSTRLIEVGQRK